MKSLNDKLKKEIKSHLNVKNYNIKTNADEASKIKYILRSEYIKRGYINDPKKGYHLEYNYKKAKAANDLVNILSLVGIDAKISVRDNNYIVYIKNKSAIIKLLDILGSKDVKKEYRDISKINSEKLNVSRKVNFEVANIKKVANASVKQLEEINTLLEKYSIHSLDDDIRALVIARKKYPTASLTELGELMGNVSKSTLNHRFRKIREMICD